MNLHVRSTCLSLTSWPPLSHNLFATTTTSEYVGVLSEYRDPLLMCMRDEFYQLSEIPIAILLVLFIKYILRSASLEYLCLYNCIQLEVRSPSQLRLLSVLGSSGLTG